MPLNAKNLGPLVYELFHEVSEGLQGKITKQMVAAFGQNPDPKTIRESILSDWDVQNPYFTIYNHIKDKPTKSKRKSYTEADELHIIPGFYDVSTWFSRQAFMEYCKQEGYQLPPLEDYQRIQRLKSDYKRKASATYRIDKQIDNIAKKMGFDNGNYLFILKKKKLDPKVRKLIEEYFQLLRHKTDADRELDKALGRGILVFSGLNEPQIHYYGNRSTEVPSEYMKGFQPIQRRDLSEELAYSLDGFLRKYPRGTNGLDIGPHNSLFSINGKKGMYTVHHLAESHRTLEKDSVIFTGLSIDNIRNLVKR